MSSRCSPQHLLKFLDSTQLSGTWMQRHGQILLMKDYYCKHGIDHCLKNRKVVQPQILYTRWDLKTYFRKLWYLYRCNEPLGSWKMQVKQNFSWKSFHRQNLLTIFPVCCFHLFSSIKPQFLPISVNLESALSDLNINLYSDRDVNIL